VAADFSKARSACFYDAGEKIGVIWWLHVHVAQHMSRHRFHFLFAERIYLLFATVCQ
jgi:hypothetical protein